MKYKLLIPGILFCLPMTVLGQDTSVPDSVRLMIQRSQAASQYEQMARMQLDAYYRDYIDALEGGEQRRQQVESAIVEVLSERAELSVGVAKGQNAGAELAAVNDYSYLRGRLEPLLSAEELAALDARQNGPTEAQLQREYAQELSRSAPGLPDDSRKLVLDTLVSNLRASQGDSAGLVGLSVDELVARQMQTIARVGAELQSKLPDDQWQQVAAFLNQLQGNLFLNRSMLESDQ